MFLRPLNEILQKVANEQLNEDPQRVIDNLQTFKKWITEQPHLMSRTDDQFLVAFLRNCKYNLVKAQQKLDNYYAYIEKNPELLRRPHLEDVKFCKLLKCGVVIYLPQPITQTGPRILLMRIGAYDPKEFAFAEILQFRQLMQDILFLSDDIAVISGLVYVMDFGNAIASHYLQFSPPAIEKVSKYLEEAVPLNLQATHFVNAASTLKTLFNVAKLFMPLETRNKTQIHASNLEEFYKFVPQDILPLEYGGKNSRIQDLIDQWEERVLSYVDYFHNNDEYGVDESLRISRNLNTSGVSKIFGIF